MKTNKRRYGKRNKNKNRKTKRRNKKRGGFFNLPSLQPVTTTISNIPVGISTALDSASTLSSTPFTNNSSYSHIQNNPLGPYTSNNPPIA